MHLGKCYLLYTLYIMQKAYIGETGRRQGDRFWEHLRDFEKDDKDTSKPVSWHFNLPNHSEKHFYLQPFPKQGTTDSRKNLEQRFIFQIGTLKGDLQTVLRRLKDLFTFLLWF